MTQNTKANRCVSFVVALSCCCAFAVSAHARKTSKRKAKVSMLVPIKGADAKFPTGMIVTPSSERA